MKDAGFVMIMIIAVIVIALVVTTLIGALALWVLGHFIDFEFSWWLAFGIGIIISVLAGGSYNASK